MGRGKRIVYLSEHPALALIEVLVHLKGNPALLPETYQLMKVVVPGHASTDVVDPATLSAAWRTNQHESQMRGDAWLETSNSALLAVPSAPSPESTNYLLNPHHPAAGKLTIEWCRRMQYDHRLFHLNS